MAPMRQRAAFLAALVAVAVMLPPSKGRPQAGTGYGSWGTFSGIGGSASLSGSGSLGTNVGVGVHHSSGPGGVGGQYGLNVFGGKTASVAGNGAINLGAYQGGYRHPYSGAGHPHSGTGYPSFGGPGYGGYGFMR